MGNKQVREKSCQLLERMWAESKETCSFWLVKWFYHRQKQKTWREMFFRGLQFEGSGGYADRNILSFLTYMTCTWDSGGNMCWRAGEQELCSTPQHGAYWPRGCTGEKNENCRWGQQGSVGVRKEGRWQVGMKGALWKTNSQIFKIMSLDGSHPYGLVLEKTHKG